MNIKLPALIAAVLVSSHAYAQRDCHVGAFGGAIRGQSQHVHSSGMEITDRFEVNGSSGGVGFGCDWAQGTWFTGFEADLAGANASGDSRDLTAVGPTVTSGTRIDRLATLRVRLGRHLTPTWSLYGTAGAAVARATATIAIDAGPSYSDQQAMYGAALGGGVEARLARALSLRLEYLYVALAKKSFFDPPPAGLIDRGGGLEPELHMLRVGLNLHF